jgi:hypothetical protein
MPSPQERALVRAQLRDLLHSFRSGEALARAETAMARAQRARMRQHWLFRVEDERDAQDEALAELMRA